MINNHTDRPVHLVYGGVDVDDREEIRRLVENETPENNGIIVASYGTFSTGVNIKRLHNLIFASQASQESETFSLLVGSSDSLGGKTVATLYDIADDISTDRGNNYTLNHLIERFKNLQAREF